MKKLKTYFYKSACTLCELLERRLYDEKTWLQLENENFSLQNKIEELQDQIYYLKDIA